MKQLTITVEVPDDVDLERLQQVVTDATFYADNITQKEHNLITEITTQLIKENESKN
jgi:hypothetical protein